MRKKRESLKRRGKSFEREPDATSMPQDLTGESSGELNLFKKCSNLTKFSQQSRSSVRKPTSKFK